MYTASSRARAITFGYEGRCAAPSNFDSDYCYSLGFNASYLVAAGLTGYLSSVRDLLKPPSQWKAGGVPLTMMMNLERRHGKDKPVILKALVELKGNPLRPSPPSAKMGALEDDYQSPGPIQFWGPPEVANAAPETRNEDYSKRILAIFIYCIFWGFVFCVIAAQNRYQSADGENLSWYLIFWVVFSNWEFYLMPVYKEHKEKMKR
jgi:hypothetical protein